MAGIIQAAYIADVIAITVKYSVKYMKESTNSIFTIDTYNLVEIFPDICSISVPFGTPIGLCTQILAMHALEDYLSVDYLIG